MVKELKVAEAYQGDVGRGIARIDPYTMEELGLKPGDVIEIEGAKTIFLASLSSTFLTFTLSPMATPAFCLK